MMKFAFNEVSTAGLSRKITDDGWFPHQEIDIEKPVEGFFSIRRTGDTTAVITGTVSMIVLAACDMCGKSVSMELTREFTYECIVGKEEPHFKTEIECGEEDYNKIYLEESVIDVGDLLREQAFLAMPMSTLCQRDCRGLCPGCGADLNCDKCICETDTDSSPFTVLKQLKGR